MVLAREQISKEKKKQLSIFIINRLAILDLQDHLTKMLHTIHTSNTGAATLDIM